MKTYLKSLFRMFPRHLARFFTLVAIIIVSVGFMSGLGEVKGKINYALNNYYIEQNVSDFIIKSESLFGFSSQQINILTEKFGKENIMKGFSYDVELEGDTVRVQNFDLNNMKINKLELLAGRLPQESNEVVVERQTTDIKGYSLGDKITFNGKEYNVTGIVRNPMIIHQIKEPSFLEGKHLDNVIYLNNVAFLPVNDIYITLNDRGLFDCFSKEYKQVIDQLKSELELDNARVLTLYENYGIFSLNSYANKVGSIASIFVVFFLLVTALVVFSTMTRLLDEERGQMACLKTLGYGNFTIISKYLFFITIATLVGGLIAWGVGIGLTDILYIAFGIQYAMPSLPTSMPYLFYLFTFVIILLSSLLVTLLVGFKITRSKPATLLTPKAPPAGKRVLMEKMPFVWNKLSFKYKSSFRNVFLFKSRFLMTVISIIGSTVLVLAGLGLLDNTLKLDMGSSLVLLSTALIVFAGLLCALVIYNIANINISERNREVATLMVLGYHNKEVTGYIFREIYIMSAIGAIIGLPIGYGFIEFIFNFIEFGSSANVNWWTWILAPCITIFFTFISTMLLYRKVTKTDMNGSLKTVE